MSLVPTLQKFLRSLGRRNARSTQRAAGASSRSASRSQPASASAPLKRISPSFTKLFSACFGSSCPGPCQDRPPFSKHRLDETSGVALALRGGVPTYQVEDEEGRTHLLIHLPIEEEDEDRWCLWRPDQAGFDSRSIFEGALVQE